MSFLNKLNEITRPKITEAEFDFGDGPEKIHFRGLSYDQRQGIFVKRLDKDGKLDIAGSALHMNAELLAATLVDETGKPIAKTDAILQWDSTLVDKLADLAGKTLKLIEKKDEAENPSTPQS